MRAEQSRAEWLATLRGIAALLVYISHLKLMVTQNLLFTIGRVGVTIFFLITGYLTYTSYKKRTGMQYLVNRLFRMYPEYWVLLMAAFIFQIKNVSAPCWMANITLFNEFMGYGNILGASWMMPIQICFFVFIFFFKKYVVKSNAPKYWILFWGMVSLGAGYLRYATGKPIPTAFPLLFLVALLGIEFFIQENGKKQKADSMCCLVIFEAVLIMSTKLSYDNWLYYVVAYNIGIVLFVFMRKREWKSKLLIMLGEIGFPFFLCFDIIFSIMVRFGVCEENQYMSVSACIIHFVLSLAFAVIVTKWVEKPILRYGKALERKMASK